MALQDGQGLTISFQQIFPSPVTGLLEHLLALTRDLYAGDFNTADENFFNE